MTLCSLNLVINIMMIVLIVMGACMAWQGIKDLKHNKT